MDDSAIQKIRKKLGGQASLEGAIDAMGKEKEEQVLTHIREFTDLVMRIVDELEEVVRRFAADEYAELAQAVAHLDDLESEIDHHKARIADQLALGGVFPMGRADLARLVTSMDRIANYAAGTADRLALRPIDSPPEFNQMLVEMVKIDVEAVRKLHDAVFAMRGDFREAIEIASGVDKIESRADDVYAQMYHFMYDWDTDYKTFLQLKSIIQRLENIADACAENAELIRHMALEYMDYR